MAKYFLSCRLEASFSGAAAGPGVFPVRQDVMGNGEM